MNIIAFSILIVPLLLTGAPPAAARPMLVFVPGTSAQVAADDAADDRETFSQKAHDDMQEWRRTLREFSDKADAIGKKANTEAEVDLNKAWTKAETACNKLRAAGVEGWENARASYERASDDLIEAWRRMNHEDK